MRMGLIPKHRTHLYFILYFIYNPKGYSIYFLKFVLAVLMSEAQGQELYTWVKPPAFFTLVSF
jgi:hypothetical protein